MSNTSKHLQNDAVLYFNAMRKGSPVSYTFRNHSEHCEAIVVARFIATWLDQIDEDTRDAFIMTFIEHAKKYISTEHEKENRASSDEPDSHNFNVLKELYSKHSNGIKKDANERNKYSTEKDANNNSEDIFKKCQTMRNLLSGNNINDTKDVHEKTEQSNPITELIGAVVDILTDII